MQTRKLRKYEIYEVSCSALVSEGYGLVHLKAENLKYPVKPLTGFILGILPSETGYIKVTRVRSKHFFGVLLSQKEIKEITNEEVYRLHKEKPSKPLFEHKKWALLNVSKERVDETCESFTFCGGCKLLHLPYEKTLEYKKNWLNIHFQREKIELPNVEVISLSDPYHYRNNIQVHINKYAKRGFYAPMSYRTMPFPEKGCLLFDQNIFDKSFPEKLKLERCIRSRIDDFSKTVNYASLNSPEDKNLMFQYNIEFPEKTVSTITIPNTSFFQVNSKILPLWLKKIEGYIKQTRGEKNIQSKEIKVLEIFSGFGFITSLINYSLPLKSMGIDILKKEDLKKIKIENNLFDLPKNHEQKTKDNNVALAGGVFNNNRKEFEQNYIEANINELEKLSKENKKQIQNYNADIILINPPRGGFMPSQIEIFFKEIWPEFKKPIIYSSCNAATFARDVNKLKELGYQLKEITLFDFFPWTSHFEVLGLLL
ncbi:MAG: hypothetical protein OEZ22_07200 [Spirochaetia bacterium]|nr:hypothetical protein [Spirochaetia bacterium]